MRPKAVPLPVCTTTPRPAPVRTTVPMNAHDGRSRGDSDGGAGATFFSAGVASPVSTASSHVRSLASRRRRSAGTTSPTARLHDVAGHQLRDADLDGLAVAEREGGVTDAGVERLDGAGGPVLVEEPEPDAEGHDAEYDQGVGPLADEQRRGRRRDKQDEQRALDLAEQHVEGVRAVAADRVRADFAQAER